ncbi:hypothetical protein K402DRAFT_392845, partial [Aulographum hederae CBS 113979]
KGSCGKERIAEMVVPKSFSSGLFISELFISGSFISGSFISEWFIKTKSSINVYDNSVFTWAAVKRPRGFLISELVLGEVV